MQMLCVETGRKTKIKNENDIYSWCEQFGRAATRLIRRRPEFMRGNYFASPSFKEFSAKIGDERVAEIFRICKLCGGLTERTGVKFTFRLID
jgi:hypothetical protein